MLIKCHVSPCVYCILSLFCYFNFCVTYMSVQSCTCCQCVHVEPLAGCVCVYLIPLHCFTLSLNFIPHLYTRHCFLWNYNCLMVFVCYKLDLSLMGCSWLLKLYYYGYYVKHNNYTQSQIVSNVIIVQPIIIAVSAASANNYLYIIIILLLYYYATICWTFT